MNIRLVCFSPIDLNMFFWVDFEMELPLSKQGKINGERRVFQDKCTDQGSPDQYFFIARKSNVFSLLGNGAVTKEHETALFI